MREHSEDNDAGLVAYFGYGSLVNRATHRTDIVDAIPARLYGWRRSWVPRADTSTFNVAILSVVRDADAMTEGLLIVDRLKNLPQIDERERAYKRSPLTSVEVDVNGRAMPDCLMHVYEVPTDTALGFGSQRILRSYLDAVLQGFLIEHGEDGVRRFVSETDAFEIGILDDRANPLYQRQVALTDFERELFDSVLARFASVNA